MIRASKSAKPGKPAKSRKPAKAGKSAPPLNLYAENKADYASPSEPVLLNIAPAQYLAIDGQGEPGGAVFQDCIGALYGAAFTIKMTRKKERRGRDYMVCKLESLWGGDDASGGGDLCRIPRAQWRWTLLIRTPDFIDAADLRAAHEALLAKGKPPIVRQVRLERIAQGCCVQALHVGPYERVADTINCMQAFAAAQGLTFHGRHHEVYLSDPRRVPPARLRTILRHPVR